MLSFKTEIEKLNRDELRFAKALECYLGALNGIQENAVEIDPELTAEYQRSIQAIHRNLSASPDLDRLDQSRSALLRTLEDYRAKSAARQSDKESDLRSIVGILSEAAETLAGHNDINCDRLRAFTRKLQTIARGTDLAQIRRDLDQQVVQLRSSEESMRRDNEASLNRMQSTLKEFQQRLQDAERRASTDSLTGLLNHGEGELRLRKCLERGDVVSLILFDLNGFKQINDRWGHTCGDQVLKSFSHTLANITRVSDTVCRWGGDEFLVILQGDESLAQQRASEMQGRLRIPYKVMAPADKNFEVEMSVCFGVAQAQSGDTADDVVARADGNMYRNKYAKERS
jgi:diguanylate cyclase (GGDEF)-like protein